VFGGSREDAKIGDCCATQVTDGMKIKTKARRLSKHATRYGISAY